MKFLFFYDFSGNFKFLCSLQLTQGVNVGQIVDKSGQTAVRARLLKIPEILASAWGGQGRKVDKSGHFLIRGLRDDF